MATAARTVTVGGQRLRVTNLDRVLYPETGTTKAEVIEYWQVVAPAMLPHLRGRPATRKRWPDGVGAGAEPGSSFFRKNLEDSAPRWVPRRSVEHRGHTNDYPVVESAAVLAWFGQVAALEIHVPQWRFDADGRPGRPDRLVLDLDPGPGVSLADCAEVARWCREILSDIGLEAIPVTSGSKGLHLYTALDGNHTSEQISQLARELARSLEADHPDAVVSQMKRSSRAGKVFIDWSQNNSSKTTVAPYSLRGTARPTAAAPRTWAELADADLRQLDYREVIDRLGDGLDPMSALAGGDEAEPDSDRLEVYRSKRDARKTPEPVPQPRRGSQNPAESESAESESAESESAEGHETAEPQSAGDPIFVIQEHHARRLHYDTRVERDGVLVSWAVPKGPPLRRGTQRLAVQTEDHPMEYASFEGTIPRGEYGGGEVSIWDSGHASIETWDEGKVVVVLQGTEDGGLGGRPRRYALIRTDGKQWLIRLTNDQPDATVPAPVPARSVPSAGTSRVPLPDPLPAPMLATRAKGHQFSERTLSRALHGDGWVFEGKWDGYRAIAGVDAQQVHLRSRSGEDFAATFPELAELSEHSPVAAPGTVLDGEIVALGSSSRPDFGRLQLRGRLTSAREIARAQEQIPVHYFVFDILYCPDRGDLRALEYTERRGILHEVLRESSLIHLPPDLGDNLTDAMETSRDLGLEGVVAKRATSAYRSGRRSADWLKFVHHDHQEVVIIGWRHGQGARSGTLASLLMAVPDIHGELRYAGRVGTGFSDAELSYLRKELGKVTRATPPADDVPAADSRDATWVTPRVVGEVKHHGRTRTGRLRQPVWRGTRPDKDAAEVSWDTAEPGSADQ